MDRAEIRVEIKKQKKYFIILLILIVSVLLCLHYCGNTVDDNGVGGLVYGAAGEDMEEIDDETPLGSGNNRIVFPGFSTKVIKYSESKQMSLQNPKANTVDFVYTIICEGEEVYVSGPIKPGETQKWNLHEVFTEEGTYEVTIHITPYDSLGAEKNGFKQNFAFRIA